MTFVALLPGLLNIAQLLLDFHHFGMVTCVLTKVVTELDSGAAICSGNLDDNVKWLGLFSSCFVRVVICNRISIGESKA